MLKNFVKKSINKLRKKYCYDLKKIKSTNNYYLNTNCSGNGNNNDDDDDHLLMTFATYLSYYYQK